MKIVLDKASELNCGLGANMIRRNEQGFFVVPFFMRTPSKDVLDKFVEMAGVKMGLVQWYPIQVEPDYLGRLSDWDNPSNAVAFIDASHIYGKSNGDLRKTLSS